MQYIFHAGGTVSAADTSGMAAMAAITLNVVVTAQTIQAAWEEGVERILVFSSSTAYPEANHAITEDEMWSGPPYPGYFGYAWLRRYTERLCEFTASESKMKIAVVRPTAVYGRWDTSAHVIPSLVRRALGKPNPFVVWGTGEEVRDFLHVSDLARGCLLLLEKHAECDPVNIGYGSAVTIKQTVQAILRAAGHERAEIVFDPTKPGTIPFRMVDISKARRLLGFEPKISLEDGLADTVKWFQANPHFADPK
jgi:GDP-L-fucose synthase